MANNDIPKFEDTTPIQDDNIPKFEDTLPHPDDISPAESAVKGFGNGVTLGWLPNIEGGAQSALDLLKGNPNVLQNYRKHRDENYQDIQNAQSANPKSFLGGNLAGGAATALVPGLGEASLGKLAALGGVAGLGGSRADLTTGNPQALAEGAADAAKGAGIGVAAGALAQGIGGALSKAAAGRTAAAESGAAEAVGASPAAQAYRNVGKTVLDNGVLNGGGPLTQSLQNAQGAIENLTNDRDLYLTNLNQKLSKINPTDISQRVGDIGDKTLDLINDLTNDASRQSSETAKETISNISAPLQDYALKLKQAGNNIEDLNGIKGDIDAELNKITKGGAFNQFNPNMAKNDLASALEQLRGVVKQHIQDLADVAEPHGGTQLEFKNQQIANLSDAIKGIKDNIAGGDTGPSLVPAAINSAKAVATGFSPYSTATAAKSLNKAFSLSPQTNQSLSSGFTSAAQLAKQYGNSVARTGSLYTASDDELKDLAQRLQTEDGTASIGQSLQKAIDNNDPAAKNRAIFVIKQTTGARDIADKLNQGN